MDEEQITEPTIPDATVDPPTVTEISNPIEPKGDPSSTPSTLDPTPMPAADEVPLPLLVVDEAIPEPPTIEPVVIPEPPQTSNTIPQPSVPSPTPVVTPIPVAPEHPLPRSSSPELTTGDPSPLTVEPFDINSLSDADLKAAAVLYTKRNQAEISRMGVAKRKETMELNQREIVDFLSLNNGAPLPRIAKHTNITLGTTSKYLRQLNANGKVRAEGWGKTRRYYLK